MFDKLQYEGEELENLLNNDNLTTIAAFYIDDDENQYRLEVLVDDGTLILYEDNEEECDLECVVAENNYGAPVEVGQKMYLDFSVIEYGEGTVAFARDII